MPVTGCVKLDWSQTVTEVIKYLWSILLSAFYVKSQRFHSITRLWPILYYFIWGQRALQSGYNSDY